MKILIVDDDQDISLLLSSRLEANGFSVVLAKDGEEGLAKYLSERPDVMLLDSMMPKMSGHEVLAALAKKRAAGEAVVSAPIIMLTARADTEAREKILRENVAGVLLKPFLAPELLDKIREVCGQ